MFEVLGLCHSTKEKSPLYPFSLYVLSSQHTCPSDYGGLIRRLQGQLLPHLLPVPAITMT
jgi:hypothetical protein